MTARTGRHAPAWGRVADRSGWTRLIAGVAMAMLGALSLAQPVPSIAPAAPTPSAIPASRQAQNLAIITIKGEINAVTAQSVERRIREAERGGADGIVIELDTPGGEVGAVLDICRTIRTSSIPNTIAWVNRTAYSGGAIIALACREIVVAPGSTMGDAGIIRGDPLGMVQGLAETERSKVLTPLLLEMVDNARRHGYDEHLVVGFVTLGVELWRVEEKATGRMFFLSAEEYRALFDAEPPRGSPEMASLALSTETKRRPSTDEPGASPGRAGDADPARAFGTPVSGLTPETIDELNSSIAGLQEVSRRPNFARLSADDFIDHGFAMDGTTFLTLRDDRVKLYGLASATIADDQQLQAFVGATSVVRLDQSWIESLVGFMTQGMSGLIIRGILIVVFLLCMFIEFSMPGVGAFGLIALVALAGLVVPPMLMGASNWWALLSIVGGLALILMEIFVFPGFGVPGLLGLVLLLAGLIGTFAGRGQLFPGVGGGDSGGLTWAMATVLLATFAAGVGMYLFSRYTHSFPIAGKLILGPSRPAGEEGDGLLAAMGPPTSGGVVEVGQVGVVTSSLRPSGTVEFGDQLVDVVSEFGFIEPGRRVRVTSVNQYRVAVEPAPEGGPPAQAQGGAA